jgi:hypothetical protein
MVANQPCPLGHGLLIVHGLETRALTNTADFGASFPVYFPSTEKAINTLPGVPPAVG